MPKVNNFKCIDNFERIYCSTQTVLVKCLGSLKNVLAFHKTYTFSTVIHINKSFQDKIRYDKKTFPSPTMGKLHLVKLAFKITKNH